MNLLEEVTIQCPYCWEIIEVLIDCSAEIQQYTEDCEVCCRPIILSIFAPEGGLPQVEAQREHE